jgi:hypothetical protein
MGCFGEMKPGKEAGNQVIITEIIEEIKVKNCEKQ